MIAQNQDQQQARARFSVMQPELEAGLKAINGSAVSTRRALLPCLKHVRLEARDGWATLATTDLAFTQIVRIPAHVSSAGAICTDYATLKELTTLLNPAYRIDFETIPDGEPVSWADSRTFRGTRLMQTCGPTRSFLTTLPASDYPALPRIFKRQVVAKLEQADLAALVKSIGTVKSREATFEINGQAFRLDVGALYRAWQNLKAFEKKLYSHNASASDYPAWIGYAPGPVNGGTQEPGALWLACHNYGAFIAAELVGIAVSSPVDSTANSSINAPVSEEVAYAG